MEITQDKIDLISKIIRNDRKFKGHEDLFEDFLNEACSRSVVIINAIDNEITLEAYLKKIVSTSILKVLKDSGRLHRTRSGYMTTEVPSPSVTDMPAAAPAVNEKKGNYKSYVVDYGRFDLPVSPEENAINNEVLEFVADTIQRIDSIDSKKKYLYLFSLRYDKGMTQKEIAQEMGISQSEVSKRLYQLIDKVKKVLDEQ